MSKANAARDQLSFPEANLLLLLDTAGVTLTRPNGSVRWALDAEDVCDVLMLAHELIAEWNARTPLEARRRAAHLLGVPVPAKLDG